DANGKTYVHRAGSGDAARNACSRQEHEGAEGGKRGYIAALLLLSARSRRQLGTAALPGAGRRPLIFAAWRAAEEPRRRGALTVGGALNKRQQRYNGSGELHQSANDLLELGFRETPDSSRAQVSHGRQREDKFGDGFLVARFDVDDKIVNAECEIGGLDFH